MLKKWVPAVFRSYCKALLRNWRDRQQGLTPRFARQYQPPDQCFLVKKITLPITPGQHLSNKIHNLQLAAASIHHLQLQPGEIFSFWHLVRNPSARNGYRESRAIVDGNIQPTVGGGLCQLSGLIYYLALHGGLFIMERHAHSADIYREEERFTPLGSDATVVYGYKDLRIENKLPVPVIFSLQIENHQITGCLHAHTPVPIFNVTFSYAKMEEATVVTTICASDNLPATVFETRYRKIK